MSAESLEESLRALGIECRVEAVERLAVLIPDGAVSALEDARIRREAIALLRDHGFTHLALEIMDDARDRATVHRD